MPSHLTRSALCALAMGLFHVSAFALGLEAAKSRGVTWTLVTQEVQGQPGETVIIKVVGEIPKGWHTYSLKKYHPIGPQSTTVAVQPNDSIALVEESVSYDPKPYIEEAATKAFGVD